MLPILAVLVVVLIIFIILSFNYGAQKNRFNPLRRGGALAKIEAELNGTPPPEPSTSMYTYRFSYDPALVPGHEASLLDLQRAAATIRI